MNQFLAVGLMLCATGCANSSRSGAQQEREDVTVAELDPPSVQNPSLPYDGPLAAYAEADVRSTLGILDVVQTHRYTGFDCVMHSVRGVDDRPTQETRGWSHDWTIRTLYYLDRDLAVDFEHGSVCGIWHLSQKPIYTFFARCIDDPTYRDPEFGSIAGASK